MNANQENHRIGLEQIPGDWLTHKDFVAWSGLSKNAAYEVLRQDPYRQAVRRFGRQCERRSKRRTLIGRKGQPWDAILVSRSASNMLHAASGLPV